jgi:hypothetical protein
MQESIVIPARFRGPPESGNGGYVAGAIAACFESEGEADANAAIQVTLRAPPPLDRPMPVLRNDASSLQVILGETLIADAARTELTLEVPEPPTFAAALAAAPNSPSLIENINPVVLTGTGFHPICFCCGADVEADAGLHVYAAPVDGFDGVAAAWHPSAVFADTDGYLPERIVWAALDCPGQFAYLAAGIRTGMLGRITGRMVKKARQDQDFVVIGWCLEVERSKHFAGTALFDATGHLCAYTKQVWIGRRD